MKFTVRYIYRPSGTHYAIEDENGVEFARAFDEETAEIIRRALNAAVSDIEAVS